MPNYKHGTLYEFIVEQRNEEDYLQAAHLFSFAIDVTQAMSFLHSQQVRKSIVPIVFYQNNCTFS